MESRHTAVAEKEANYCSFIVYVISAYLLTYCQIFIFTFLNEPGMRKFYAYLLCVMSLFDVVIFCIPDFKILLFFAAIIYLLMAGVGLICAIMLCQMTSIIALFSLLTIHINLCGFTTFCLIILCMITCDTILCYWLICSVAVRSVEMFCEIMLYMLISYIITFSLILIIIMMF